MSTKRKKLSKYKKGSRSRKYFNKSRKSKTKTKKMSGGAIKGPPPKIQRSQSYLPSPLLMGVQKPLMGVQKPSLYQPIPSPPPTPPAPIYVPKIPTTFAPEPAPKQGFWGGILGSKKVPVQPVPLTAQQRQTIGDMAAQSQKEIQEELIRQKKIVEYAKPRLTNEQQRKEKDLEKRSEALFIEERASPEVQAQMRAEPALLEKQYRKKIYKGKNGKKYIYKKWPSGHKELVTFDQFVAEQMEIKFPPFNFEKYRDYAEPIIEARAKAQAEKQKTRDAISRTLGVG